MSCLYVHRFANLAGTLAYVVVANCINRLFRSLAFLGRLIIIINYWCFLRESFAQYHEMDVNTINFIQKVLSGQSET